MGPPKMCPPQCYCGGPVSLSPLSLQVPRCHLAPHPGDMAPPPSTPCPYPASATPPWGFPGAVATSPPKNGTLGVKLMGGTLVHRVTPQPLGCLSPSPPVLAQGGLSWGSLCVSPPPQQRLVDSNPQHLPPPLRTQHTFPWDPPMVGILGGVLSVSPGPLPEWGGWGIPPAGSMV